MNQNQGSRVRRAETQCSAAHDGTVTALQHHCCCYLLQHLEAKTLLSQILRKQVTKMQALLQRQFPTFLSELLFRAFWNFFPGQSK